MLNRQRGCLIERGVLNRERGCLLKRGFLLERPRPAVTFSCDKGTKVDRNTRLYFWCCIKFKKETQTVLFYM